MLPPRIPKKPKRESRWRSPAHTTFVRSHACSYCGSTAGVEAAHVRYGSGTGMGRKPDDWLTVSLCYHCHHFDQHIIGEQTFWENYFIKTGQTVHQLIIAFCKSSPKAREIADEQMRRAA